MEKPYPANIIIRLIVKEQGWAITATEKSKTNQQWIQL